MTGTLRTSQRADLDPAHWRVAAPTTRVLDYWDPRDGNRRTNKVRVTRTAHLVRGVHTVCGRSADPLAKPVEDGDAARDRHLDWCWRCTAIGPVAITHRQMTEGAAITYRQLDHWTRQGWLQPHEAGAGSGTTRTYPAGELDVVKRMATLTRAGVTASVAAQLARDEAAGPQNLEVAWATGRGECA